jgi:hypothetical protein
MAFGPSPIRFLRRPIGRGYLAATAQLGFKYFLGKRLGREVWCRQGNEVLRQICGWLLRSNARRPFGGLLACVGAAKSVRKRNLSPIPRPQPRRQGGQTEAALVI